MSTLSEREQILTRAVDKARLQTHTETIAQWERLSGSEPELKAFEYVKGVLDDLGYKTSLTRNEAYISLPRGAALTVAGLGSVECITHSMGVSVEGLKGEIVYVGLGRPDDYARANVRGKVALVEGIAMPVKVKAGEDAGAIAQIHISGDHLHEMCVSTVWGSPTPENVGLLPSTPQVTIRRAAGDQIRALLEKGSVTCEMTTKVESSYMLIPTLTGDIPGTEEPDKFVLFSGHIDSWYFGAMDNGSANATMLEVARVAAQHGPNRRGLRMAFWSGHSHGRYAGSTWYVDNHWEELYDGCVAHVNCDSTGGKGATVLTESCAAAELRPLAGSVIAALTGQEFEGTRVGRAGDHSFMGVGVPALFMDLSQQPVPEVETSTSRAFAQLAGGHAKTGGLGWWWHTPEDTLDKVDFDLVLRDTQVYAAIIDRLLNQPVLPYDLNLTVAELEGVFRKYQQTAGDRFDLSAVVTRAEELKAAVADLHRAVGAAGAAAAGAANRGLLGVIRPLTVLSYTESGPFEHDRALGGAAVPLLRLINTLPSLEPKTDRYRQTVTALVRRRNAVCFQLRQAAEAAREAAAAVAGAR